MDGKRLGSTQPERSLDAAYGGLEAGFASTHDELVFTLDCFACTLARVDELEASGARPPPLRWV